MFNSTQTKLATINTNIQTTSIMYNQLKILQSPKLDSIPKYNVHNNHLDDYISDRENSEKDEHICINSIQQQQKQHSTPLQFQVNTAIGANSASKLKANSFKQANHVKLKYQTSPYSISNSYHHQHLQNIINSPTSSYRQPRQQPQNDSLIYNLNTSNSIDTSSDDLSSVNKTNPPTTPISSMLHTSAESCSTSPSITTLFKRQEIKSSCDEQSVSSNNSKKPANEAVLHVTPATSTSPSSCSQQLNKQLAYSSSTSACSSTAHTTYSRSSSYTSLSSFDLRSTHSSVQSEYSGCNTGYCTPGGGYSDLPDSPGDPEYPQRYYANVNRLNHNFLMNLNPRQIVSEELSILTVDSNPSKSNDITIMERTIINNNNTNNTGSYNNDSTHSSGTKAKRFNNSSANRTLTLNQTKQTNSNGSSAYNSEANSFLGCPLESNGPIGNNYDKNDDVDDDERVISYDMEGSLCDAQSTRSNTSNLTFPNEPTADLTFIRNLLNKKALNSNTHIPHPSPNPHLTHSQTVFQSTKFNTSAQFMPFNAMNKPKWAQGMEKQFTPPVKLSNNDMLPKCPGFLNNNNNMNNMSQVNRSLFNVKENSLNNDEDGDNESIRHYGNDESETNANNNEDKDDVMSILSVPSEIRAEPVKLNMNNKSNFNALFNKASSANNSACVSFNQSNYSFNNNTIINNQFDETNAPRLYANDLDSSKQNSPVTTNCNRKARVSLNNDLDATHTISYKFNTTLNNPANESDEVEGGEDKEKELESDEEDEDDDKRDFYDFIDEVFSKRNNNESDDEEPSENEENANDDGDDDDEQISILSSVLKTKQNVNYKQVAVDNDSMYNRILPKIDEDDESEEMKHELNETQIIKTTKLSNNSKLGSGKQQQASKTGSGKVPVIHLTKTARLRFEKLKEHSSNSVTTLNTSQSVKRSASRMTKDANVEKKSVLSSSQSSSKSLSLTPKQNKQAQVSKKPTSLANNVNMKCMRSLNGDIANRQSVTTNRMLTTTVNGFNFNKI